MNKRIKVLILSIIITSVSLMTSTNSSAVSSESTICDEYAENFAECDEKGIPYNKPLTDMTYNELVENNYSFYDFTNEEIQLVRTPMIGRLGYIYSSGVFTARTAANGISTIVGSVKKKDIVRVNSLSGNYANITFIDSNNTQKTGYILSYPIYTPNYNWVSPTGTTGNVSQFYGDTKSNPSGHSGVDIVDVGTTTSVVAVNDGTAIYKTQTCNHNGTTYYVQYGRYVFLDTTAGSENKRTVYGHLSQLNGCQTDNYPSEGFPGFGTGFTVNEIKTKSVLAGEELGKTGTSGQSSGCHLHFEVRDSSSTNALVREDPFLYVVFPKITCS